MIAYELKHPGRTWPEIQGWWLRALFLNGIQAAVAFLGGIAWDQWFSEIHFVSIEYLSPTYQGVIGYLVITFVFYWWHRARHESSFLWRWFHQVHHSPSRVEILTTFYKHPFELIADSILCSAILFLGLGSSPEGAAIAVLLSAFGELFYHWNVKTPYWLGFIFQRPESHCLHHARNIHGYNYSDLPLWDMLFGTFHNPRNWNGDCGLGDPCEKNLKKLLFGIDCESLK